MDKYFQTEFPREPDLVPFQLQLEEINVVPFYKLLNVSISE